MARSVAFTTAVFAACITIDNLAYSNAFSMNLFDRFARVTKSSMSTVINRFENPENIMTQAVIDMQGDLLSVRQSYAEVTANQRRLIKKREQMDSVANDWYRRAQLAIQTGNDVLGKEALVRRQMALDEVNNMIKQIDIQNSALEKLYNSMILLEKKIVESKSKKEQMIARARTARAATKVNDMLSGITGKTSMDAFKRMEEKVEALEAQAEISMDMVHFMELPASISSGEMKSSSSSYIEREFQLLEAQSSVDEELANLKKKLLLGGSTMPDLSLSSSPAARSMTTTTTTVTTTTKKDPVFMEIP